MTNLEQAAREVVRQHSMECLSDKAVDALREALAEQAKHEPVAWTRKHFGEDREYCEEPFTTDWTPLYAAPVRTKDLTDDEIFECLADCDYKQSLKFARAVIAADREKNK